MKLKVSIAAMIVIAVTAILYRFNPAEFSPLPRCLFHQLTGLNCPGCGMQRFVHAMLHGRIAEAVGYNAFLLLFFPYCLVFAAGRLLPSGKVSLRLRYFAESRLATTTLAAAIPVWFVVRNLLGI